MRKSLFMLAIAAILAITAKSQSTFGLKAGANIANLKASGSGVSVTLDSKVGFHGGGFVTIPTAKNFSIQPELVFSMEGAKYKALSTELTLNYINLPVMFQYNASGFIAETGPQLGFLLSAKEDAVAATDAYQKIGFSWAFGAAYRFTNGVGISGRYNLGLSNVDASGDSEEVTVKSNVLQFGLTFNLKNSSKK